MLQDYVKEMAINFEAGLDLAWKPLGKLLFENRIHQLAKDITIQLGGRQLEF